MRPRIIFVEGVIGAGKTTFCDKLIEYLRNTHDLNAVMCEEPVGQWVEDGTLEASYTDPSRHSFSAQCHFFNTRVDAFQRVWDKHADTADVIICERSMLSDKMFFITKLKQGHVEQRWADAYFGLWSKWQRLLPVSRPSFVVYLKVDCNTSMTRLAARGRAAEKSVASDYQQMLVTLHDEHLLPSVTLPDKTTVPTVTLDGAVDFKDNAAVFESMAEKIVLQLL